MGKKRSKAVAVKYDDGIEVPIVMARGQDKLAEKIFIEAEKNHVVVTENTELVDMLGICNVGGPVPEEAWSALAQIFAFILENRS